MGPGGRGAASAFQADDDGSIPFTRSNKIDGFCEMVFPAIRAGKTMGRRKRLTAFPWGNRFTAPAGFLLAHRMPQSGYCLSNCRFGAAAAKLQHSGDAVRKQRALIDRQRRGFDHDSLQFGIGQNNHSAYAV